MWMAWFRRRFPRRDRRQAIRLPEDTSIGAVPVVGGETVPAAEPGHVAGIADHRSGDDRARPEDLGQGRAGGADCRGQLLLRLPQQGTGAAQAGHELGCQFGAGLGHGAARLGLLQDLDGVSCVYFLADTAGDQFAQRGVQPAGDLVAGPAQVAVPLGPYLQHGRVVAGPDRQARR
jgi:hypothetical protein